MKKLLSLLVAMAMLFTFTAAFAEEEWEEFTIEITFEGYDVTFDDGFQVSIPDEWYEQEMEGFAVYGTETEGMTISYQEGELTFDELLQALADRFGDVNAVSLNGILWGTFMDEENDTLAAAALGDGGYYIFTFGPASDEELVDLAQQIMATVVNT